MARKTTKPSKPRKASKPAKRATKKPARASSPKKKTKKKPGGKTSAAKTKPPALPKKTRALAPPLPAPAPAPAEEARVIVGEEPALAKAPPPVKGVLVFEGKAGEYHRSDARALEQVSPGEIDETDRVLKTLGFSPLGDLVSTKLGDVVIRGYGLDLGDSYGIRLHGPLGGNAFDFFSVFEEGAWLVTTTTEGAGSFHEKWILRHAHPELANDLGMLYTQHVKQLTELMHTAGAPRRALPDLRSLAATIDEALSRERV